MFYETDIFLRICLNVSHIQTKCGKYQEIFREILLVPHEHCNGFK